MNEMDVRGRSERSERSERAAILRRAAAALLDDVGVLAELRAELGTVETVGSVDLDLMTWPDIDLYTPLSAADGDRLLAILPGLHRRLTAHGHTLLRVSFHDRHRNTDPAFPDGLYLGLRIRPPAGTLPELGQQIWKIDLWGWEPPTFAAQLRDHAALAAALAGADRDLILRIKDAASRRPSYRDTVTSVDVYAFALAGAGTTLAEFDAYLGTRGGSDDGSSGS